MASQPFDTTGPVVTAGNTPSDNCSAIRGTVCFGLGIALGLALLVAHQHIFPVAYAQEAGKTTGQWIALGSGLKDKRGNGCLWVYHPDKRQLACYINNGSQHIKLVGARRVMYDLELETANDRSDFTPKEAREKLKAGMKDGGGGGGGTK